MPVTIENAIHQVGECGRYQIAMAILLIIPATFPSAFIGFNQVFVSASPDHWCKVPELIKLGVPLNLRKNLSIPYELRDGKLQHSHCEMYAINYTENYGNILYDEIQQKLETDKLPRQKCLHGWEYDHTYYDATTVTDKKRLHAHYKKLKSILKMSFNSCGFPITLKKKKNPNKNSIYGFVAIKFDLVCDKNWWPSFNTSMFYFGSLLGTVIFGWMTDKYGRKPSFFIVLLFAVALPTLSAFSPNYTIFTILRFFIGFMFPALYQTPFILALELTSAKYRTGIGMIAGVIYGVAMSVLCGMAALLRHWFPLTIVSAAPFAILFVYWWIIPESPRWLVSQNRLKEAEEILQTIAKTNKKQVPNSILQQTYSCSIQEKNHQSVNPMKLFATPNMFKKSILIMIIWLVNAIVYVGLSYMSASLGINDYLAFAISGLVEAPACLLAWYGMEKWGRRWSTFISMFLVGLCCIGIIFVDKDDTWLYVLLPSLGKFGITGTFSIVYIFGCELLPTVIRGTGMAVCGIVCGIGLIGTPFITYLVVYSSVLPLVIMGILSIAGGVAAMFLPETFKTELPQTIEEGEAFGKNVKFFSC